MLTQIGLIVIILAWLYQLVKVASGDKQIQPAFAGLYAAGVILLVADAFLVKFTMIALLNVVSLATALGVFALLMGKKKEVLPPQEPLS